MIYLRKKTLTAAIPAGRLMQLVPTLSGIEDQTGKHTFTAVGSPAINTTITKNGQASVRIARNQGYTTNNPGTNDRINIQSDKWNISSWFYPVSSGSLYQCIATEQTGSSFYPLQYYNGSWYVGDGVRNYIIFPWTATYSRWVHVNCSYDGVNLRLHINGQLAAKAATGSTPPANINTAGWNIGRRPSASVDSDMYLGSLEIDRGTARDDASFLPNYVSGEGLLGKTNHLSYADHADLQITGDRTIEAIVEWSGVVDTSTASTLWGQNPATSAQMRFSVHANGVVRGCLTADGDYIQSAANGLVGSRKTHVAMVKSGTTYSLYIGGTRIGTKTGPATIGVQGVPFFVGSEEGALNSNFLGRITEFAFSHSAKYTTATITEPTTLNLTSSNPDWANIKRGIDFTQGIVDVRGFPITNYGVVV